MATYGVVGGTLWGNRGAEAMVVTTIGEVRQRDPDARFLLLSYLPSADRDLLRDDGVAVVDATPARALFLHVPFALACWLFRRVGLRWPDTLLPAAVRRLRRTRALFDVSGISFHDGRLAVVAYNIVCVWPALLVGVPVVRLSQAMGPFRQPLNRLPARWITRAARHTFARGRRTAAYVQELRVPSDSWSIAADVAFAYRDEYSLTDEHPLEVDDIARTIGVLRREWGGVAALVPSSLVLQKTAESGEDYIGILADVVAHLHERGLATVVVPNATRSGSDSLRNNDIVVIERLREHLREQTAGRSESYVAFVEFDLNTAGIRRLLAGCELVVTSRFHAMVAGLALGVPTVVMGWSHKYEEILEMFGCAEHAIDFAAGGDALLSMIDRLLEDGDETRTRIGAALPVVIASSRAQFEIVARLP